MFDSLYDLQRKAVASLALKVIGLQTGGHIDPHDPVIFGLFVDFFGALSQEEILPIMQDVCRIGQGEAEVIVSSLDNDVKRQFKYFMLDIIGDDKKAYMALALILYRIGLN